jgi:beta-lactam-binding protein with PASTA domain
MVGGVDPYMSLRRRVGTLFRLFLLFTVLVAVALLTAITTIRMSIRGRQETMPNLVAMPVEAAERIANDLGLVLKIENKLYSTQVPADRIVSQMPPLGTPVKGGQHVHVLVSLGPPRAIVPDLVGTSLRAARIAALERGMTVGNVAMVHWSQSETDRVMAQDPPPSTGDVRTPAVNFLVSLGEPPTFFLCPNFVGKPLTEARTNIEKSGFKIAQATPVPTTVVAPGIILVQTPPPGSKIGRDAEFTFQVAQ